MEPEAVSQQLRVFLVRLADSRDALPMGLQHDGEGTSESKRGHLAEDLADFPHLVDVVIVEKEGPEGQVIGSGR